MSSREEEIQVTARAITYYLDVSNECTRRITQVDGAVRAICQRLAVAEMNDRSSKDLGKEFSARDGKSNVSFHNLQPSNASRCSS